MERKLFKAREIIFRQGDPSREVYRVISGSVTITIRDADSGEVALAEIVEGDIFGEMAMLDESPRSATARAKEPCDLEIMEPGDFNALFMSNPEALAPYLACLIDRLRSSNEKIQDLTRRLRKMEEPSPAPTLAKKPALSLPTGKLCSFEPLNPTAKRTLPREKISITKFPFRIGRSGQQKGPDILQCNDLSLINIDPAQVAKNHISIEKEGGEIIVRDRNTRRGTIVNGKRLHQDTGELICPLTQEQNEIVLGDSSNNAAYRLTIKRT